MELEETSERIKKKEEEEEKEILSSYNTAFGETPEKRW
jgi:hypothetical protein